MTRQEAKELLPIITAFAEGKEIQILTVDTGKHVWKDQGHALGFSCAPHLYRVKPEPNKIYIVKTSSGFRSLFSHKEDAETYIKRSIEKVYLEEYIQVLPS